MIYLVATQVGIGNTNPIATLQISVSDVVTPSNDDRILIPRVDEFPAKNPTITEDGLMVLSTRIGMPSKGFYYWNSICNAMLIRLGF